MVGRLIKGSELMRMKGKGVKLRLWDKNKRISPYKEYYRRTTDSNGFILYAEYSVLRDKAYKKAAKHIKDKKTGKKKKGSITWKVNQVGSGPYRHTKI